MASTKNPQAKPINQGRGPTTGNGNDGEKRKSFIAEKRDGGNERTRLAEMITSALEGRGRTAKPAINPGLEGLHSDTGPKRNPTAGGTQYNVRSRTPGKITK